MTEVQQVLANLLSEIKAICEANDIKFILHSATAAKAVQTGTTDFPFVQICVSADDFSRLIDLISASLPENRRIDYMGNNKLFNSFAAKYSDTSTTCIKLNQNSNFYSSGIYVEINVVRKIVPNSVDRVHLNLLEHGWEGQFRYFGIIDGAKYTIAASYVKLIKGVLGKEKTAKYIFSKLDNAYSDGHPGEYYIKSFNKRIVHLDVNPLKHPREVEFLGDYYPVPRAIDSYLRLNYSIGWRQAALRPANNINRLVSTNVSSTQMQNLLEEQGFSFKKYAKIYNDKFRHHSKHLKYDKYKDKVWASAKVTSDRIELLEYYTPKMDLIRNLFKQKEFYSLNKLMARHRRVMVKYLDKGEGFAVNKELFEIQMTLFEIEGKFDIVEKIRRLTPAIYMKSVY